MLIRKGSNICTKAGKVYFCWVVLVSRSHQTGHSLLDLPEYLFARLSCITWAYRCLGVRQSSASCFGAQRDNRSAIPLCFRGQAHSEQVHLMMQLVPFAEESGALLRCSPPGETASGRPFTCAKAGAMHVRRLKLTHSIFYYPLSNFSHSIMPICTSKGKHSNHSDQSVIMTSNSDLFSLFLFFFPSRWACVARSLNNWCRMLPMPKAKVRI